MPLISRDYLVLVSDVKHNKTFKKENHLEVFLDTGVNALPQSLQSAWLLLYSTGQVPLTHNPILPLDPRQSVFSVHLISLGSYP